MPEPRRVLESQLRSARTRLERAQLAGADPRGDQADVAGNTELRNLTGMTRARAREQARLAAAALERLDAGTWGKCLDYGEPIAEKRLIAMPEVEHCIACAETLEQIAKRDGAEPTAWAGDED